MTELVFEKKMANDEPLWEAVAKVGADFNLHIERVGRGSLWVGVSTVEGGRYSELYFGAENRIVDKDFDLQVYPKFVCVRSFSEPLTGYVNDTPECACSGGGSGSGSGSGANLPIMTDEDVEEIRAIIK